MVHVNIIGKIQMSKQTAVEWLENQLKDVKYNPLEKNGYSNALDKLYAQAKAMEREQIIKAFCEGYDHDGDNYDGAEISYYNRTYKGGEQ
jgi:predicted GNAT superfamily acetyltransferase